MNNERNDREEIFIISEIKKELDFLSRNYEVPLDTLTQLVEMLSERLEVTTPFNSIESCLERDDFYNRKKRE